MSMHTLRRPSRLGLLLVASLALGGAAVAQPMPATTAASGVRLGQAEPNARAPGTIRLATYNILNLFDDRDDPSKSGRNEDIDDEKPASEKAAVAEAIRRVDADVLALQEIESFDALIEFREEYLAGMGYDHAVSIDVGEARGIEQAVLSRFPIAEATVWPHMPLEGVHPEKYGDEANWLAGEQMMYRRSPLKVRVEVPTGEGNNGAAYELTLFVVHHKSGRHSGYWREAEARKVVELVRRTERLAPGANIVVLGDFNAEIEEDAVRIYRDAGLHDVFGWEARTDRTLTHESDRAIDLILVNGNLRAEVVEGSAFVLGTPLRAEGADWRTVAPPAGFASDHLPVVVDMRPED